MKCLPQGSSLNQVPLGTMANVGHLGKISDCIFHSLTGIKWIYVICKDAERQPISNPLTLMLLLVNLGQFKTMQKN